MAPNPSTPPRPAAKTPEPAADAEAEGGQPKPKSRASTKYAYWRRSIVLGALLSAYLGCTRGGAYGWVPALLTLYSAVHLLESAARRPDGVAARIFLVVTNLQRVIDLEDALLAPFRPSKLKTA